MKMLTERCIFPLSELLAVERCCKIHKIERKILDKEIELLFTPHKYVPPSNYTTGNFGGCHLCDDTGWRRGGW